MANLTPNWPVGPVFSPVVEKGLQVINSIAAEHQHPGFVYHHYERTIGLLDVLEELAIGNRIEKEAWEIAALAILFCDAGRWLDPANHHDQAIGITDSFCDDAPMPGRLRLLEVVSKLSQSIPTIHDKELQLALDAVHIYDFAIRAQEYLKLVSLEHRLLKLPETDLSANSLVEKLTSITFLTPFARAKWSSKLASQIAALKTSTPTEPLEPVLFSGIEKKIPIRGLQTFFRSNYRSHLNLSAIADNKANIMISINTILVSVLISVLTYKNITETQPKVLMPLIIFLITGLTSLIFAILSVRPKITSLVHQHMSPEEKSKNLMFFGSFVNLSLPEYEEAMDQLLKNSELLYGNMSRDLYYLGKVLDKKYKLLTVSYHIFMLGFAATVISFLALLLF